MRNEAASMFERFTDRARTVIKCADDEAVERGDLGIETFHILLALARDPDSIAAQLLVTYGASLYNLRHKALELIPSTPRPEDCSGQIKRPFTSRAKSVLELSIAEAMNNRRTYIGAEHLLQALLGQYLRAANEQPSSAVRVLQGLEISINELYESARRVDLDHEYAAVVRSVAARADIRDVSTEQLFTVGLRVPKPVLDKLDQQLPGVKANTLEYWRVLAEVSMEQLQLLEKANDSTK